MTSHIGQGSNFVRSLIDGHPEIALIRQDISYTLFIEAYNSGRSDFHMRFNNPEKIPSKKNLLQNSFQDFKIHDYIHSDYQIDLEIISELGHTKRQPIKTRALNTINHFTGIVNYYRIYKQKNKLTESVLNFGPPDKTANTIFQKID